MFEILVSWVLASLGLFVADRVFDGVRLQGDFGSAMVVAAIYSLLSAVVGWLLFGLLGIATLGLGFIFHSLARLVVAAIVLKFTSALSSKVEFRGFFPAFGTAVFLALAAEAGVRLLAVL